MREYNISEMILRSGMSAKVRMYLEVVRRMNRRDDPAFQKCV